MERRVFVQHLPSRQIWTGYPFAPREECREVIVLPENG